MKISVVVPAYNEEGNIEKCIKELEKTLKKEDYELVIVNDGSKDKTGDIIERLRKQNKKINQVNRSIGDNGFGKAVKEGYKKATGDYVALFMADLSDDLKDLQKMITKAKQGYDVIIGNRFTKQSIVTGYPKNKLIANRLFNNILSLLLKIPYKDLSNAFKMYKKEIIKKDFEADDFDITIEVPVKAYKQGYKFVEIPNNWYGRKTGSPKFGKLSKAGKTYTKRLIKLMFYKY